MTNNTTWFDTKGAATAVTNGGNILFTNQLPGLTNGFVTSSITNGLATTAGDNTFTGSNNFNGPVVINTNVTINGTLTVNSTNSNTTVSNLLVGGWATINGVQTNNGAVYGTTQTNSGSIQAASFTGDGGGLTNIVASGISGTAVTNTQLVSATNALATTNYVSTITNGLATTAYVIAVTNGGNILFTNQLPGLTNGFVDQSITNGLASTNYVNTITNGLATTNYVNTATNNLLITVNNNILSVTNNVLALTTNLIQNATNNVLATATNSFYGIGNPSNYVTASVTNALNTVLTPVGTNLTINLASYTNVANLTFSVTASTNLFLNKITNAPAGFSFLLDVQQGSLLTNNISYDTNKTTTAAAIVPPSFGQFISIPTNDVQCHLILQFLIGPQGTNAFLTAQLPIVQ